MTSFNGRAAERLYFDSASVSTVRMITRSEPETEPAQHNPATPWLLEASSASEAWFASITPADAELAMAARQRLPTVCRQALARTLLALGREGLVAEEPPVQGDYRCKLAGGECILLAEGFHSSIVLLRGDLRRLSANWRDGTVERIEHPARLLEIIAAYSDEEEARWQRLATEITDSLLNEALSLAAHERTNAGLAPTPAGEPFQTLIHRLRQSGPSPNAALFLDQWAATGHPLHTVPKARVGLPPATALKICPEFHPRVLVRLSAVRRDRVGVELPPGVPRLYDWFVNHFPNWLESWRGALQARGLSASEYEPFPVHPWQADNIIADAPAKLFQQREIELLDGPELAMLPGLSVRSLVPAGKTTAPGFKLALGIRLTSGVRTITPRSCHMGRRVSQLLRDRFEQDARFEGKADILDEPVGAYFDSAGALPEFEKQFSFLARDAVSARIPPGHIAVTAAALAEPFPVEGPPLLLGLAEGYGHTAGDSLNVFEHYASSFLGMVLRTYLVYGIALEAHGQNVIACFNENGQLSKFLFRDLAGIRIHEPTLKRLGIELDVHPDRRTVVQDFEDHHFWLRHRAYHAHLGHIAHGLSVATGETEARYWRLAGEITDEIFGQLRSEVEPEHWKRERHMLLEAPWSAKASLRMRLMDQVRDLPFTTRNPLKGA